MFVVLRMSDDHYSGVMKDKDEVSVKDHKASISYTKVYNVLNADHRTELMDLIFWLASVQKHNFHKFYYN